MRQYYINLLSFILFPLLSLSAGTSDNEKPDGKHIEYVRNEFYVSLDDEDAADRLIKFIHNEYGSDQNLYTPRILAYLGAVEAVMAKYTFNPFKKLRYVIKGLEKLGQAVEHSPEDLEVRFLRFAVLHNIPALFGVGDERESDMESVVAALRKSDYSTVNASLQKGIIEFMLESGRLNVQQQNELQMLLPEKSAR